MYAHFTPCVQGVLITCSTWLEIFQRLWFHIEFFANVLTGHYIITILKIYCILTRSWQGSVSDKNQSIDLQSKSVSRFLCDMDLLHERVNGSWKIAHWILPCILGNLSRIVVKNECCDVFLKLANNYHGAILRK